MTGPEHYQAAEDLLERIEGGDGGTTLFQAAQLHMGLAQAAATAATIISPSGRLGWACQDDDWEAWGKAVGVHEQKHGGQR